jgi:hypothetical protein
MATRLTTYYAVHSYAEYVHCRRLGIPPHQMFVPRFSLFFSVLAYVSHVVYVCSFLAMLNSRQRTRRPSEEDGIPRHLLKLQSTVSFRNYSLPSAPARSAYSQVCFYIFLNLAVTE